MVIVGAAIQGVTAPKSFNAVVAPFALDPVVEFICGYIIGEVTSDDVFDGIKVYIFALKTICPVYFIVDETDFIGIYLNGINSGSAINMSYVTRCTCQKKWK